MKIKEWCLETKKNVEVWWDEHGDEVITMGIIAACGIFGSTISYAFGQSDGRKAGEENERLKLITEFGENPTVIREYDEDGKRKGIDALVTERFYEAFKDPSKIKWYDDGSFDYVDEL